MATKTADKKKLTATTAPAAEALSPLDQLTENYLAHRLHLAIVSHGEPSKIADIVRGLDDEAISMSLIRHTLSRHPSRFVAIDRRWDIAARYLDKQRPALRLLQEIVSNFNEPITAWDTAHEFALVSGRTTEGALATVEKILRGSGLFAELRVNGNSRYVSNSWLLQLSDDYLTDSDVLFYNFLAEDAAKPYEKLTLDWENDAVGAVEAILTATKGTDVPVIDNRVAQFLAWKALGEDFDSRLLYAQLLESDKLAVLPGHLWATPATLQKIRSRFVEIATTLADIPEEEEAAIEEAQPLTISADDYKEFETIIKDNSDRAVRAQTLLQEVFEIGPGDRTFASDYKTVLDSLRASKDRFDWVGYDRFRMPGTLPPFIGQVPESLTFPVIPQIETPEGDLLDQLLEDEGFERGLEREVLSAVAQDVNDQEPYDTTVWPEGISGDSPAIDLVLKAHHKEIGTFPLSQIPQGFFATEPGIVEITLRDQSGAPYQVFADYETQLLYGFGLFDLYAEIPADSGAIIRLEKTAIPGEFTFVNTGETHPDVFVSPERMEQLQSYRAEIEAGPTVATHDIARYILEHSNSAMTFLGLLTETNIVRRVSRRQLASIISEWTGFVARTGTWSYDSKKATQGYNKAKRKYMIS